jgi:hypothetical protein
MKTDPKHKLFLDNMRKDFAKIKRPLSKVIMADWLSAKFNLSPDYCKKVVAGYCEKAEAK